METVKEALMSDTAREIVMVIMAFLLAGCTAMFGFTRGYERGMNKGKGESYGLNIKYIDKNGITVDAHYSPVIFAEENSGDNKYHIGLNDRNVLVVYSPAYTSK